MALIIFDYGGVPADTLDDLIRFCQEACNQLGIKHLVTKDDLSQLKVMSFSSYGRGCEVPEHLIDQFVKICLSLFAEKEFPPAIFADLSNVTRHLSLNHKIAIVTTNSSRNVNAFLIEHGPEPFIDAVHEVNLPGSKEQRISMARNQLLEHGKQEAVFMVGDSLSDILAAKEASVTSIAATRGHQSLEKLPLDDPDFMVRSPRELAEVIEQ